MLDDDYFSLEEILLGEERYNVKTEVSGEQLGELDPTHILDNRANLEKGTKLQLPLWLALRLAKSQYIELNIPDAFSQRIRDALMISADSVSIKSKSDMFWELGSFVAGLMNDLVLSEVLKNALTSRISLLIKRSTHSSGNVRDEFAFFEATLGALERQYVERARKAAQKYSLWRSGQSHVIESTEIANAFQNSAKRAKLSNHGT